MDTDTFLDAWEDMMVLDKQYMARLLANYARDYSSETTTDSSIRYALDAAAKERD